MRGSGRQRLLRIGKWIGLPAFAVVAVAAVVRLGRENYWYAPFVLGNDGAPHGHHREAHQ
jgi:hypothetical protein